MRTVAPDRTESVTPKITPEQVVTLSFFRFHGLARQLWALGQLGLARPQIARLPELDFWKLMGTGPGEGFAPARGFGGMAVLTCWPDLATAEARTSEAPVFRRFRERAAESLVVHLTPFAMRGEWSGAAPFRPSGKPLKGPVAALTRTVIRPRAVSRFWARVPAIRARLAADPNLLFKIGLGEVPWRDQITFTIWPDSRAMAEFARLDGPHAAAIRAVRAENWFSEELYVRFRVRSCHGSWNGRELLALAPAYRRTAG